VIRIDREGDLWWLVLNRPDKANALTQDMLAALDDAVAQAVAAGAKAIVLTGEGKVFSAGADLDGMANGLGRAPEWGRLSARLDAAPCLTVAALNGTLAGGAFHLALPCDLRLCVEGAEFFYPVMKRGYLPQPSDPQRLAALVGPARAREVFLAGARIGAEQALHWGLVNRVVPREALRDETRALCADVLAASADHSRAIKALFT
jgi:enoyl-CoA hydratase/carnithine racemase